MGLFDRFKKKEEPKVEPRPVRSDRSEIKVVSDGRRIFEYYEAGSKFKKFYDTTRIVVGKEPQIVQGTALYDLLVSWYSETDCIYLDPAIPTRRDRFEHIVAGIDPSLMETNPEYLEYAVKVFLEQKRITQYVESSMMTEEELKAEYDKTGNTKRVPCGRYVGEITVGEDGKLGRGFRASTGKIMHHTPEMEEKRVAHKAELEKMRQARIANKRDQMAKLQAEIDEEEK